MINRRENSRLWVTMLMIMLLPLMAVADVGVIIPKNVKDTPDPSILALHQMSVRIRIDGQYARVSTTQIYRNLTNRELEGKYLFTLPDEAQVSDFAIWEDGMRIPGIIVERRRAREIYEELTFMKIDPGLLESGGVDSRNIFSVEIFPIPSQGTKRVEIEYTVALDVSGLRSIFNFPLKPNLYGKQSCAVFNLDFELISPFPLADFAQVGQALPMEFSVDEPTRKVGTIAGKDVDFTEDFAVEYRIDVAESLLRFLTYRKPERYVDLSPIGGGDVVEEKDGYVAAQAVFNQRGGEEEAAPKDVILLVDTSLSMQWDKLERSYEALEYFLKNLPDGDRFALMTFNDEVNVFRDELMPAGDIAVPTALSFFRNGYLSGGTDMLGAVKKAVDLFGTPEEGRERFMALITDGAPTAVELRPNQIIEQVKELLGDGITPMVFGIGNDTNTSLLGRIAESGGGHFTWASESEDLSFKLRAFLERLGEDVIIGLSAAFGQSNLVRDVYSDSGASAYDRSMTTWIGRYSAPGTIDVNVSGNTGDAALALSGSVELPESATEHDFLPRRWAKLRVDHLLGLIDRLEDKNEADRLIEEVIALAKRYKFVTPYTSFLAAPRALLRPRAIKPGDPILRVHAHESIRSVVAVFPFGLTKPLHYITDEEVWETRFLAPKDMRDGNYDCTLLLTDDRGSLYEEKKKFVIDSKPPTIQIQTEHEQYAAGDEVVFNVHADSDTRRILIRVGDLLPVEARYRTALGASEARLRLPLKLPPGRYAVVITAVDFARNTAVLETHLDITAQR